MPLLGKNGVPFVVGNRLVRAVAGDDDNRPTCRCCDKWSCVTGGEDCQSCEVDKDGVYATLEECEEACPPQQCLWCVETTLFGPCGEEYPTYSCTVTDCDDEGECIAPGLVEYAGPLKVEKDEEVNCYAQICPEPPAPPPVPECCYDSDCPCCHSCVNGQCVYQCPSGYTCVNCECVPPPTEYYCCQESGCSGECEWEVSQEAPPPFGNGAKFWLQNTYCEDPVACYCPTPTESTEELSVGDTTQTYCTSGSGEPGGPGGETSCHVGPCPEPLITISGPHYSLADCCAVCGCEYSCSPVGYYCFPDPLGIYDSLEECEEACDPGEAIGACCRTIAPNSQDNAIPGVDPCTLYKDCAGMMTFAACEALKTNTGTNTSWYAQYNSCDLCPVTQVGVCCAPDENDPCGTVCSVTDESCCDEIPGSTYYVALQDCEDTWPSGLDACRTSDPDCSWPEAQEETVQQEGSTKTRSVTFDLVEPPAGCEQIAPEWIEGYPDALTCDWRYVTDYSRCVLLDGTEKVCQRLRVMRLGGDKIVDITELVLSNPEDMTCCVCRRGNGADCTGDECEPLPYFDGPEADCLP